MAKLFGDIASFTAKADVQVLDSDNKETVSMPMDFALLDKKIRVAIDLSQMKNSAMPPGMADTIKQMGMAHVVNIIRPDKKLTYTIYPDQKILLTLPLPAPQGAAAEKEAKVEKTPQGKETIDGHPCVKNKITTTDEEGKPVDALTWNATDLKDFPIKIETKEGGNTALLHFKDIQLDKAAAAQFDPPPGYKEYSNQQELMQAMMQKMMQAGPPK